jgi:tetratricopeptide (TPR) repeat protein
MKTRARFAALIFVSMIFFASSARAADGAWVAVRSKNFNLIGNAAEADVRAVAAKLEQFRAAFQQLNRQINFNSPVPTTVIVFRSEADYAPYKPVHADGKPFPRVAGYFLSSRDANYITLAVGANLNEAFGIIFHEYTHFLLDNNIGRGKVPAWLNEGLAEYYQMFRIENDRRVTLGALQTEHLKKLAQNELMPPEKFFNLDNYTLHQQSHDGVGLFYAQAWATTHFLLQRKPVQTEKFLASLIAGTPPGNAFEDAFQMNYAQAFAELKKYLAENKFGTSTFDLKENLSFDPELKSAPLGEAETKTYLGELLLRFDRLPEAEKLLREVLRINENGAPALIALGNVKLKQKKYAEARELFRRAAQADDKNYLAFYNYALAISREDMSDFGFIESYTAAQADEMRRALKKAIELNPNFAESYELFALVAAVRNEGIDEAVALLNNALKIAPGNQNYQIRLAELYFWKEDFANARRLALNVARTASDFQQKLYAENTVNKINAYEAQLESIRRGRKKDQPDPFDRIYTEEELRQIRERGFIESINQLLTKPLADEKRVLGYLTRIECQPKNILYFVRVDNQILKFRSESFETVNLVALNAEMFQQKLVCGNLSKSSLAVVLFRPDGKDKLSGEVRAIEFVPPNFRFLN